ncbi:MAG TPA: hypothetical protein ENJ95_18000 [Bacteroidetes bacterium]|nr:hypothetical protein [Bacteroidota bacterium]
MKQLAIYPISVLAVLFLAANTAFSQFDVTITVNSGWATSTCTDPIGGPQERWGINIEGQGWTDYPGNFFCPQDLPNQQFSQSYQCVADIPATLQVCLRGYEDDASILDPCTPVLACGVEQCFDIPIPMTGSNDLTLELADGQASDAEASITIAAQGIPGGLFDHVCDALDVGVLQSGSVIGDADVSVYNNYCATWQNEPSPWDYGAGWINNQSIWVKFTTNDDPSSIIKVWSKSDPSNLGDPINLQVAIFKMSDHTCTGTISFVTQNHDPADWDELIYMKCPEPNTDYYILIDAVLNTQDEVEGYFSLEISELGLEDAPNRVCDALELGAVPEGGSIGLPTQMTNVCADNITDPNNGVFSIQHGVWFSFAAPLSGHVLVEGLSDTEDVPIDLELAVYASQNGDCNGNLVPVAAQYDDSSFDETMEVSCLNPGQTYYLMVDGRAGDFDTGIFTVNITDAGDDTPVELLNETLCFGETLTVGTSVYGATGSYTDTLYLPSGCDSIVLTNLLILPQLELNFSIVEQGVGEGNTDGQAQVAPTGGAGGYTVTWTDGQTTALASNLVGGDNYCVNVEDTNGCQMDTCFEMPFLVHFVPTAVGDALDCNGDQDGTLNFTANSGIPPYLYSWQNATNTLSGSGMITADGEMVLVKDLPAGQYSIHMVDIIFDTTVVLEITQPDVLEVTAADAVNASCFSECDGSIGLVVAGGTPPYQVNWSNGTAGVQTVNLCAGNYAVEIMDANGCTANYSYEITQPEEFIAQASQVQAVSCFEGNDGIATVSTNGSPVAFLWDINENTETVNGLEGGVYSVTVTNTDGCTAEAEVEIITPDEPVSLSLEMLEPVICNGAADGVIKANVSGPGEQFTYFWNNETGTELAEGLPAGTYEVVVENELGCQAAATFVLDEPTEIVIQTSSNILTCSDPVDGGVVSVDQINGGVGPYTFSSNGAAFSDETEVGGFFVGAQTLFVKDAGGCVKEFPVTIEGPVELAISIGNDRDIELGDEVTFNAQVNVPDVTYSWFPEPATPCDDCDRVDYVPTESGLYTLTVTDEYDCTAVADAFVNVLKKRKVYVPNAFSPNNDGFNDEFMPYTGKDVRRIKEFRVFDRQGNMVFEAEDFVPGDLSKSWNGIFRGKMMQPAVFGWYAAVEFIDDVVEVYKGDVTLVK